MNKFLTILSSFLMFFLTASFSFAIDPNDKKLNLDELLKNSNDKIAELDNKIKNKTSNEPASPKKSTQVTNETPKPVIEKAHLTQLRSESTSPDRMTDNLALKMAREQHKGDLTEPTAEDIEQFKKDIEDSSFSKVNSKSSDLSQNNFNIVPRDILAKDRLNSIKSRVNLLMLDRKKSVIPSTDDELIYTNNLLNSSNNQKQELIKRTQLSVLSFYNTPMNKFMMDYSFDHYYYSYHPRFNRAVNEINFNSNLFTNKRLKINIFDGFKPFGSTDPGGTDQLASVSWYNNNRFRPSLSYEVSPRTYFNFAYENYYNNWATNKINREYSVLTHSYTPSIKYSYSQLTDFELFYTLKTAEYFNRKDPDYYSNGTALSMMTKLRRNNFIGTSLGFTQRNYFNEYKNYSGLEHSVDYKLLPTKSTLYMLSAKSGIEDSSSVPPSYLFFNSISSTFSHYLLSPDLQFTMTGLYKRTTPSMSTTPLDDIKNQIDNYYLLGTLLEYRLARNIFLDLKYSFAMRDSNKDSAQTKESRYMLELKVDELFNLYPKK